MWAHHIGLGEVSRQKCKVVAADGRTHVDYNRYMKGRADGMLVHKNPKLAAQSGNYHQWDLEAQYHDRYFDPEIINIFTKIEYALFMPSWMPNYEKQHGDWLSDREKASIDPEEEQPKPNVLVEKSSMLNRPMCI